MMLPDLNGLAVFAKVVASGSFSEAARRLGMPTSTVSRRIADLERDMGVRLLERSTRSLRVTDLGSAVVEHARRLLELGDAVGEAVSNRTADVRGTLRLSAPPSISDTLLAPLVTSFQALHPDVHVQILITDRLVDHVAEGVDLAFRRGILRDSALVARRLLTYRHQLVASPGYVEAHGAPQKPDDISGHRVVSFAHWRPDNRWTFLENGGDRSETVTFEPHLAMNDYSGLATALLGGAGIGDLPPVVAPQLLREGRLVEIMPDWRFGTHHLSLVHLGHGHVPRAVRIFKEFVIGRATMIFPDLPGSS